MDCRPGPVLAICLAYGLPIDREWAIFHVDVPDSSACLVMFVARIGGTFYPSFPNESELVTYAISFTIVPPSLRRLVRHAGFVDS